MGYRTFGIRILLIALPLLGADLPAAAADRVQTLLQTLADAPGPSGYEEAVRAVMVREFKPVAASITYDGLGSVIAAHGARPEETQARLGAGPGIFLYDTSAQPNRRLVGLVRATAKAEKIPLQLDLVSGYGDDSVVAVIKRLDEAQVAHLRDFSP